MSSVYFEDFAAGRKFRTAAPRKITDGAIRAFAELSGDLNGLHVDDAFAKRGPFGARVAHGLLGLSVGSGLLHDLGIVRESIIAFTSLDWAFKLPIRIDDEVSLELEVLRSRGVGKDKGLVLFAAKLVNQKGETAQQGEWSLMVRRKNA